MTTLGKKPTDTKRWHQERLVADLTKKEGYWVHWKMLRLALRLGYKITAIRKIMSFTQESFLADFLDLLIRFRQDAPTKFEADLAKLGMNVSLSINCCVFKKMLIAAHSFSSRNLEN